MGIQIMEEELHVKEDSMPLNKIAADQLEPADLHALVRKQVGHTHTYGQQPCFNERGVLPMMCCVQSCASTASIRNVTVNNGA